MNGPYTPHKLPIGILPGALRQASSRKILKEIEELRKRIEAVEKQIRESQEEVE